MALAARVYGTKCKQAKQNITTPGAMQGEGVITYIHVVLKSEEFDHQIANIKFTVFYVNNRKRTWKLRMGSIMSFAPQHHR